MLFREKGRKFLSYALIVALFSSIFSFNSGIALAAATTPSLSGYQYGDHVKLQWATPIQASDILYQTSFESGEEIPQLVVGTGGTVGNQSVVSGIAASGSRSLQLTNTQNPIAGNCWWYPSVQNDTSCNVFSGKHIPNGSTLSITYKVRGTGGTNGTAYFVANGGWDNQGFTFTDNNGRVVKYGSQVNWASAPDSFPAYVDGGTISIPDGQFITIISSRNTNYNYGLMWYTWNQSQQRFIRDPGASAPWGSCNQFGYCFTVNKDVFNTGDEVLTLHQSGVAFPTRSIAMDGSWNLISTNAYISDPNYDWNTHGMAPWLYWTTNGTLQVDDVMLGYATQVQLYKNSNLIYQGYLSDYEDTAAVDTTAPNPVSGAGVSVSNRYPQISWNASADNGTTYNYQIMAMSPTAGNSPLSGNVPVTVTSGIKGYSIVVDTNPNTIPNGTITTTGTSYSWPSQVSSNFYAHIAAVDNQGNISSVVHKQYTDTVQPTMTIAPSTTAWTKNDIELTATGADNETGIKRMQRPDGTWGGTWVSFMAPSNGTYTFTAEDNAGNTRSQSYTVTNIDKTAPTQPIMTLNPSGWSNNSVTVTLTPGTDNQSGVQKSQYKIGSGAWTDYSGPFTVSTEGQTVISAQTIDNVGNVSTVATATASVDKTGPSVPTLTMSTSTWTNQNVTFTIVNGVDSGSGTAKSQYKIGAGGAWTDYSGTVTLSNEGVTDVYARSLDSVGNASSTVQGTARIDKTPPSDPSITLSESTWTQNSVTFSIGGSTDVNPITYEYKLNGGSYTVGTGGTVTENGMTTVTARAKDAVGNVGNEITKTISIDNVAPTITLTPNAQGWTAGDVPVTIAYADADSGINANKRFYKVTSSAAAPSSWDAATSNNQSVTINQEGVWYVHAKAEDVAGNSFETVSQAIQLQRSASIPGNVQVTQVTEKTAQVTFDLPDGSVYTDGYSYEVTNETTGQTWTLQHPNHAITDTALEGGKAYNYTVRAINHVGQSAKSAPVTALTLPKAPENIKIDVVGTDYGHAAASFDPVESATGYRIVVKDPSNTEVYNQSVTETVYQPISNLSAGTMYTISISAINASGEGASKNVGFQSLPSAPGNFKTAQVGERDITLSWDTVTSATYYSLSREGLPIFGGDPTTSYHDTGLEPGTIYHYELYAANGTGAGGASQFSTITLPAQVTNLQVSDTTTSTLALSWDDVKGATQYVIHMNGQPYQSVPAGTTSLLVNGLTAGTAYTFDVHAENASGQGASETTSGLTIPAQAAGLQATGIGETVTTLNWSPIPGADRYRVTINGKTVEVAGTSYNVTGLEGSKTYTFSVEAGNASGYGEMVEASFLTAPYVPGNVKVTDTTESTVGLKWDAVATATSYEVSKDGQVVGNPATPEFRATGLEAGKTYVFTVKAVNATGTSSATPLTWMTKPAAPTGVKSVPSAYKAEVTWEAAEGAAQYVVEDGSTVLYRGTDNKATLTGLSDGTTYHFTVRTVNANDITSEKTTFDFLTLAKKPVELGATDIQTKQLTLDLSKTQVVGADQYLIERDGKQIKAIGADETSYTDTNLTPGTKYTYAVKAKNASGVGEAQTYEVTTKTITVSPTSLQIMPETHSVTVAWDAVPGAVSYQIKNTVTDEVYSTSGTSATLMNLPDGSKSTFELTAINESGVVSEATSFEALTKPVSPATATASQVTDTTVTLDLSDSAVRGAEQFIIERDGEEIGRMAADQISFQDKGLTPGKEYTYVVKSSNASGISDEGFTVKVRTLPATVKTQAKPGDATDSSITITWDAVEGADGYRVTIGNQVYTVTDQTSVTIEGLESAKTYENIWIIPYNSGGDAEAFQASPFDTLPVIDGLKVEAKPETDQIIFTWDLPTKNEIFVVEYDGKEVYRGTDRTFVLEGLSSGTLNEVTFHTENASGAKSDAVSYSVQTKPEAPKQVGYTSTTTSIILNFGSTSVTGAEQYVIERAGEEVGRVSVTAATYEITGLAPGTAYEYVVKAVNGSGVSDTGYTVKTTTLPPAIPTAPIPGNASTAGTTITWEAVPGATGYKVYIGEQLVLTTDKTTAELTGLESAKKYDNVRVVPFNEAGDGEAIAVPEFETLPSGDFTAEAIAKSTREIEFKWTLASLNEIFVLAKDGKELYRGKDRSFVLDNLRASTNIEIQMWTENEGGAKSEAKTVSGRTKAESSSSGSGGGGGVTAPSPTLTEPPKEPKPTPEPTPEPTPTPGKPVRFEDISTTFNKDQITYLAQQGIVSGVSETKFEPKRPITRAEFTALIVRLMDFKPVAYDGTFKDVSADAWYAPYVGTGLSYNVIAGMGHGIFAPNQEITREQASVILANVVKSVKGIHPEESKTFADQERISYWAVDRVEYLSGLQMINGYEDGTFRPLNDLTRAEAAALIYRLKDFLEVK
ncbi:fibronectin type III domain-containing protein [Paenibacillus taichungensis]